jgi:N-acetylmuramidase
MTPLSMQLFTHIEANNQAAIVALMESMGEYEAIQAATSLEPKRLAALIGRVIPSYRAISIVVPMNRTYSANSARSAQFGGVRTMPIEQLLPTVLALAFNDSRYLSSEQKAALNNHVQGGLRRIRLERAARQLLRLTRDYTRTLSPTPSTRPAAITDADFAASAQRLDCEVNAVKAVARVETSGDTFDGSLRAKILYEPHQFRGLTKSVFDSTHPHLSSSFSTAKQFHARPEWDQYSRLYEAMVLDPIAAIKACSWGRFQVMGFNHGLCGYTDVVSFAREMQASELSQLNAFEYYCVNRGAAAHLKNKDWAKFAAAYNGADYKKYSYDTKMEAAYRALANPAGAVAQNANTGAVRGSRQVSPAQIRR